MAADDVHQQRGIGDGPTEGADLIEGRGEGDQAITADPAVGGLQTDQPAQCGGLANGTAGIGTKAGTAHSCGEGGGAAAARSAGNSRGIPRIAGGFERAILGGRPHGEFIEVRFADNDGAGGIEHFHHGCIVGSAEIGEHLRRAGGGAVTGAEIVFEGNRHTGEGAGASAVIHGFGLGQRAFRVKAVEGQNARLHRFNPGQRLLRQFNR